MADPSNPFTDQAPPEPQRPRERAAKFARASDLPPDEEIPPDPPSERGAGLVRASSLVENIEDLDQGDFEPGAEGMRYKGFPIVGVRDWPDDHEILHGNQKRRFYVRSLAGTIGLVPWEGAQVVWPWEQAWRQDLHRSQVESFLKEEPKEKKRRGR
jgi:hypothetical protein